MSKFIIGSDLNDADLELVQDLAQALYDRDQLLLDDVMHLSRQRLERACRCFKSPCICEE